MAFRSESWTTYQLTTANLESMRTFQQAFLDRMLQPKSSYQTTLDFFTSNTLSMLADAGVKKIFFLAGITTSAPYVTLANLCVSMIDIIDEGAANDEKNALTAGRKAIEQVESFMKSNKDYQLVEVTFRRRIYTDPSNGIQIGMILGNPSNISAAYEIKRVRLTNGTWIEK
ncbi:hypothetical protein ACK4CI_09720 [Enterococcus gallinarum]|uniref:hypothetical protein n=1 Tax=Enterococcus TaxID=1350 RepID=UPI00289176DB|nr:hypothetical protein [Enterococcus gallinarum]MDT2683084.1 hypothetical protein [Enterococcus gallinarum]MDT2714764.1 hypothetical protein [Enterococcus gallinarum]